MKLALIAAAVILAVTGCATTEYQGIKTRSVIFTAKFDKVPAQALVDRCQDIGHAKVLEVGVGGGMTGGFGWLEGGRAYERCMKSAGYTAQE